MTRRPLAITQFHIRHINFLLWLLVIQCSLFYDFTLNFNLAGCIFCFFFVLATKVPILYYICANGKIYCNSISSTKMRAHMENGEIGIQFLFSFF